MEESHLVAKLGFLYSLRENILNALQKYEKNPMLYYIQFLLESKHYLKQYDEEYSNINKLLKFPPLQGLQYIPEPSSNIPAEWCATLKILLTQIDKGIEGLRFKVSSLSEKETLELKTLREEYQKLFQDFPDGEKYKKNIEEAIKEAERGCFLGSTLISSRVISYIFDQIPGDNISQKIETLERKGLVEEKGEIPPEYIMKADKKARNYFSHNINAFPNGSDAIELLIICKKLLKILKNYLKI